MQKLELFGLARLTRNTCPACDSQGSVQGRTSKGVTWKRCASCGLQYIREIETYWYLDQCRNAAGRLPKDSYDPSDAKIKRALTGEYGTCPPEQWRVRLHQAEKCVKNWGTLLEIGFGGCEILKFAKEESRWKRVVGVEAHPDYVLFARSLGFDARYWDVGSQPVLPDLESQCDVVLASEVMEHIDNPTNFLTGARKYLSNQGILWASFAVDKLVPEIDPDEWHWWTPEAVKALAKRCGLKIVDLDPTPFALVASMKAQGTALSGRKKFFSLRKNS